MIGTIPMRLVNLSLTSYRCNVQQQEDDMPANNTKDVAKFVAAALQNDLAEGGPNELDMTSVHHHDEGDENMVSIEIHDGQKFLIVVVRS